MTERAADDMVTVGRVARAHGNRGAVIVNPETDFAEARFRIGRDVFARRAGQLRCLTIEAVRFQYGRPIVSFRDVTTMTEAEALAGAELVVPAADLETLPEGAFYRHDLVGCRVVTATGALLGTVAAVEGERDCSRLVVRTPAGDVLVPLARGICVRIDPGAREIVIDPPEGLLELNR